MTTKTKLKATVPVHRSALKAPIDKTKDVGALRAEIARLKGLLRLHTGRDDYE